MPLGGFSRRDLAAAFSETIGALGGEVKTIVLLDNDLRSQEAIDSETALLRRSGALVHVWRRREIENYLLQPGAIAAVSGLDIVGAEDLLERNLDAHKAEAALTLTSARLSEQASSSTKGLAHKTVLQRAEVEFEELWASPGGKVAAVDPKAVIKAVNSHLQQEGLRTVSPISLARHVTAAETPDEVGQFFSAFSQSLGRR